MMYYRLLEGGEEDILKTVAEQNPVVVSIDHRTRTFMVRTHHAKYYNLRCTHLACMMIILSCHISMSDGIKCSDVEPEWCN